MNRFFYMKLAYINIKKNSQTYIPYILSCIGTVMMYYIMYALSANKDLDNISGGAQLKSILFLGSFVIGFFAVIFLFYTNSFLIKRRKKEFGLFNILGMEKKHIAKIICFETLYVAFISFVAGILGGILLYKLMYLLLLKILNFEITLGFYVSTSAMFTTLVLFSIIFLLTLLNTLRQIHLAKPVELLKGGQVGEKEPKTRWLLVIIGLLCLGAGYYIAVTTESPISAINLFFVAVILVIIGTYCLFTAISIAILKALRKNKNYYYQANHFTSISGMIYRMKQNAVGLASICVLATTVLVMVSSTVSLYSGMEDVLRTRYPRNIMITSQGISNQHIENINDSVSNILDNHKVEAKNMFDYRYLSFLARQEDNTFTVDSDISYSTKNLINLNFIPLEDYNRIENKSLELNDDEIFIYSVREEYNKDTISIFDKKFKIKDKLNSFKENGWYSSLIIGTHYIVVKDMNVLKEIYQTKKEILEKNKSNPSYYLGFDLNTDEKESIAIYKNLRANLNEKYPDSFIESVASEKESFYSLYGGLFFLGIFLSILFLLATVLIIYYKQISEGYDDKIRFEIMQKVGMSHQEIKKSIGSQILTVFFMPLVVATIHIAFAFKVITKMLAILNLTNISLFVWCTIGSIAVFSLFYAIVYIVTARVYYNIVR
ncbi:ABC transporter permease [Clostridium sp. D2Q-11]|uniref:ABC transporter permease n=1 Tax=Anaeromonas frigoriresistens TaxID=2683708 RepID=A0A942UVZ5_9FIRM|nr:ABC transporter permease [Anaeromonas frigoriresistens]MBS4539608.1 ABC transporter permease [Anaeromonas frigoriresistens]